MEAISAGQVFAVRPFKTVSEQDRVLGVGLADLLAMQLAQVPNSRVIPTHAILEGGDIPEALGVTLIVDGSLSRSGGATTLDVTIRDPRSGRAASASLKVTGSNLPELHAKVVDGVLRIFAKAERLPLGKHPEAFEALAVARGHLAERTPESLNLAIQQLESALRSEDSSVARGSLALAYSLLAERGVNTATNLPLALDHARRMPPRNADRYEAEAIAGVVADREWGPALVASAEAIRLEPGRDLAHLARAEALVHVGLLDLALIETEMVRASNPRLANRCEELDATIDLFRGDAATAATRLKKIPSAERSRWARISLARALDALNDSTGAMAFLEAEDMSDREVSVLLSMLRATSSRPRGARAVHGELHSHHVAYAEGVLAASQERFAEAKRLLIEAARGGFCAISWFENDPRLAGMRGRPEFAEVRAAVLAEVREYQRMTTVAPPANLHEATSR